MHSIEERLDALGLVLPVPPTPVGAYVPYVVVGPLVFISGQLPLEGGVVKYTGRLGDEVDVVAGREAARLCAVNALAHLRAACGGEWQRVAGCVRLGGFVASVSTFFDQASVMNGASELIAELLGESGRHARFAVGVSVLPLNASVELEALFALR
ncbi:MAG: RidA family protein [Magnetococcus sp. MYC-9]